MADDTDKVQLRSYQIWEQEGRPQGRDWDFWLQAEAELAQEAETTPSPASDAKAAKPARSSTRKKAAGKTA